MSLGVGAPHVPRHTLAARLPHGAPWRGNDASSIGPDPRAGQVLPWVAFSLWDAVAEGGIRRKDNNPRSSFNIAEKTKEPSGFCVAKTSPCSCVGLRQVTDQGGRLKLGLRISC